MLHEKENNPDTESFLKENGKRFNDHCVIALKLMYSGVKLNGNTCRQLYGICDRRLRECRQARPDVVKSAWKKDSNGKRLYVEYWVTPIIPPSKKEAVQWATEFLKKNEATQLALL